jgi:hypothetical protein
MRVNAKANACVAVNPNVFMREAIICIGWRYKNYAFCTPTTKSFIRFLFSYVHDSHRAKHSHNNTMRLFDIWKHDPVMFSRLAAGGRRREVAGSSLPMVRLRLQTC